MKKTITLLLSVVLSSQLFAQHLNYESDSKWFFGLNVGATWNTTDVKNKTFAGWGFIFGRQFNYDYGRPISFDLRLRYLGGLWYGQDFDTTSLSGYAPAYMPGEYEWYQDNPGYTVNNFETETHELGLELAIHANSLRERTGWDPYIFGGVNIGWNQTFSNLTNMDSSFFSTGYYDYSGDVSEASVNSMLDGSYDTPMNAGSENFGWNADFVPSLGFGIGYQVGPRFSIGFEHKTSFALKDDWDGFENPEKRWGLFENDVYHYSSGYLRFHIRGHVQDDVVEEPDCLEPAIRITNPVRTGSQVDQQTYTFRAKVSQVDGAGAIQVQLNGVQVQNVTYNNSTSEVSAVLNLQEGVNNISVRAANNCGQDVENTTINYVTCLDPVISVTAPAYNNLTVDQPQYAVQANIRNNATTVTMSVNGAETTNFFYNASNGSFQSNVPLREGANSIQITAVNECGTDTELFTINYADCDAPEVTMGVPNNTTVNVASFMFSAQIDNVENQSNIVVRVNGTNAPFTYNATSGVLTGNTTLRSGSNTIQITATNDCGTDTETVTVNYEEPCVDPIVTMISPIGTTQTQNTTVQVKANVQNVTSSSMITLKVNGVVVAGGTYSASTGLFQKTVNLQEGANTIQITATNDCGAQTATAVVNKSTCELPEVSISSPVANATVESNSTTVQASIQNVASSSNITLTVNGVNQSAGASYSTTTGVYRRAVTLQEGANIITITATNACGTTTESVVVNYNACDEASISIITPMNGSQTQSPSVLLKATIMNIVGSNQVTVIHNGDIVSGGTYSTITHLYQQTINLNEGINTIQVKVTTDCGTVIEVIKVTYNKPCDMPVINLVNPQSTTLTTDNGTLAIQATAQGLSSASGFTMSLNGSNQTGVSVNVATGLVRKTLVLQQGANVIVLTATNACGTVTETINVNYIPCIDPAIALITPMNGTQTQNGSVQFKASVFNISGPNDLQLIVNGNPVAGGSYSNATHIFQANVALQEGVNTIQLIATTDCGTATQAVTVTQESPCELPTITMVSPSESNSTTDNPNLTVQANIQGVSSASNIQLTLNGRAQGQGTYLMRVRSYSNSIQLKEGTNTIVITATNDCGTVTETITVVYTPCKEPVVSIIAPTNNFETTNATVNLKATVMNVSDVNQITLTVNGQTITGGTYSNATNIFQKTIDLQVGTNTIILTAVTDCGNDMKKVAVIRTEVQPEMIEICLNGQTMSIEVDQWRQYQVQGATLGACQEQEQEVEEEGNSETIETGMIEICLNGQTMSIQVGEWRQYQAQGASLGACPPQGEQEGNVEDPEPEVESGSSEEGQSNENVIEGSGDPRGGGSTGGGNRESEGSKPKLPKEGVRGGGGRRP